MMLDEIPSIPPLSFFKVQTAFHRLHDEKEAIKLSKKYRLSSLSEMLYEEEFADVFIGWNSDGIACNVVVHEEFSDCFSPDFHKGDAFELCISTRAQKTSHMNKYCHRFYFLPKEKEGVQFAEVTKLRFEDMRPLATKQSIQMDVTFKSSSYSIYAFISKDALYSYDPENFNKLLFSYTVHRHKEPAQYFSFSEKNVKNILNPNLWAEVNLIS